MALNFPSAPVAGQVFTAEGVSFVWSGVAWVVMDATNFPFATNAQALAGTLANVAMSPLRLREAINARPNLGGSAMYAPPVNRTAQRALGSNWGNTLGRAAFISVEVALGTAGGLSPVRLLIGPTGSLAGLIIAEMTPSDGRSPISVWGVVPSGWFARVTGPSGATLSRWMEY
jgi:hypothetical protein